MPDDLVPEGQTPPAGGNGEPADGKRTVSYETYMKVLDEKKKFQARAAEADAAEESRKQKELEDKGEYQKLIEQKDKALQESSTKLTALQQRETDRLKLSSLLNAIDGSVDPKFYKYIDQIDDIIINPETGEVDAMSVTKAAEKFRTEYPEFIKSKKAGLPNEAPAGGAGTKITRTEWLKLPAKEMQKWKSGQITD